MKKVLFICMDNICRSAIAEGILRDKIQRQQLPLVVDSAGTHGYHAGGQYDSRARAELAKHGIEIDDLRSRSVCEADFEQFDYLLAADQHNLGDLRDMFGARADAVQLMTVHSKDYRGASIPDPYYGGDVGFARVYSMLDESIDAWLVAEGVSLKRR